MKKTLLIILCIIFIAYLAINIVQIIDEKINGEDYEKIHKFGHEINSVIKNDTSCTKNLDKILKAFVDDNYTNSEVSFDKKSLNKRIDACFELSENIKQIPVPQIDNQRKIALMTTAKEKFANIFSVSANIIKIFNNCEKRNSSCLDDYNILLLNEITKTQSKLLVNSVEIYLTYSIKDILITRPLLFYLKQSLTK